MSKVGSVSNKISIKFESKYKDGSIVKLRIKDLPSTRRHEALDFIMKYFIRDEAIHEASGIFHNKEAMNEMKELLSEYHETYSSNILCCFLDNTSSQDTIVGLSSMFLKITNKIQSLRDLDKYSTTKEMQQLFNVSKTLNDLIAKDFEGYYHIRELVVHPEYRGLGISNELLRVSKLKSQQENIPIVRGWMTAIESQKAAENNNWKVLVEIDAEELKKKTGLALKKKVSKLKLMYTSTVY